ncbi:MBL fold metallo-hydrolase [Candidatus Woesearchaeota archaeon]|nr:MBL fold metallo-hydrolase [Candidatus Woesearchaeota archaeon]
MQRKLSRLQTGETEIWKFDCDSNVYLLNIDEPVVIDTGNRSNRDILKTFFPKVLPFEKVKKVMFTHLHFDHIGNFDLFPNAEFFAGKAEIEDFRKDPSGAVLKEEIAQKLKGSEIVLKDAKLIEQRGPEGFRVIETPGHTRGSICILYEPAKVIFSGDTFFRRGKMGRTDLPTSAPEKMQASFEKMLDYNYKVICPGHDY